MTFDVHDLDVFLLVGAAVLLVAILAVRLSVGVGLPSLLVYLGMGVALGESGVGIQFEDANAAHALGFAALVVILTEGGLTTNWREHQARDADGRSLATVGVAVSVTIVALAGHYLLGLDWQIAVLLGAVTSPTDAAAVFSVLRRIPLPRRLVGSLEAESGLNDAPTVLLVTLVSSGDALEHGVLGFAGIVAYELLGGLLLGLVVGNAGVWVMRRAALPSSGLYPIAVVAFAVLAYASGSAVHASGFAAVYVAALVLGNSELPHRSTTRSFAEGMAWLAQIGLFVMLGLLVSPSALTVKGATTAVVVGILLTFVARPASVLISSVVQPMPWRELLFISWAGLRGAVPIVLATIPLSEGVDGSRGLFHVVFVLVVLSTPAHRPHARAGRQGAARRPPAGATRPRGGGGAAGADRRGPAAGVDQPAVTAVTVSRWLSCGCRPGPASPWSCARGSRSCPRDARRCDTATTCSSSRPGGCGWRPRSGCGSCRGRAAWLAGWTRARPRRARSAPEGPPVSGPEVTSRSARTRSWSR